MGKRPFRDLGENVARLRKRCGMSQLEFSDVSGVNISGLKDIERGIREGHIETRLAIAETLGCGLSDLYRKENENRPSDIMAASVFLAKYASLPPKLQSMIYALVFVDPENYSSAGLPPNFSEALQNISKAASKKSAR